MAIEKNWSMLNSDICEVGEELGFEWNAIVDEIQNHGFYAEDADGSFTVYKKDIPDIKSDILRRIFMHIFNAYNIPKSIIVINV